MFHSQGFHGFRIMTFTTVFALTISAVLNFNFFSEFNPGGSNAGMPVPVGAPSFASVRDMFPHAMSPLDFIKQFGLLKAQAVGRYGAGETIGFIEVNGEFSQRAFQAFDREFGKHLPSLRTSPRVIVLPKVTHGKYSESIVESMLDVEWAHVVAPKARLVVFNTEEMDAQQIAQAIKHYHVDVISDSTQFLDVLLHARNPLAQSHMAAIVGLSMSHPYFTGSGDGGNNIAPATLYPNAVIVGGIQVQPGAPVSVWPMEGYGRATDMVVAPAYQRAIRHDFWRNVPDVLWLAGAPGVYTSTPVGWLAVEGTSLAGPLWAGLWALGDAAHRIETGAPLPANANATLYAIYKKDPHAFIQPHLQGMPAQAAGLGYPDALQMVKAMGAFRGPVSPGGTWHFYRWPFYLVFIELAIAMLAVSIGRDYRHKRNQGLAMVMINAVLSAAVVLVTSTLCSAIEATALVRDIAFVFMAVPYLSMIYRLDRWIWHLPLRA